MTEHAERVRSAFAAVAAGEFDAVRALIRPDAQIHVPEFIPLPPLEGSDGILMVALEMIGRCEGAFRSDLLDAIGAGLIVTTTNEVTATRNGQTISYQTVWTFRFEEDQVAEAWLRPSLPAGVIAEFYGFDRNA